MIFEWSEDQIRLLCLWWEVFAVQKRIKDIVFGRMHFDASFICPFIDLFVSALGEWRVIDVVIQRFYLLLLFNALQDINIVAIEVVQLSSERFDLFGEFIKSSDHKLYAIVWEIGISLRLDLLWRKNENGGYFFMLDCLQDQRCIIVKAKVAVEKK